MIMGRSWGRPQPQQLDLGRENAGVMNTQLRRPSGLQRREMATSAHRWDWALGGDGPRELAAPDALVLWLSTGSPPCTMRPWAGAWSSSPCCWRHRPLLTSRTATVSKWLVSDPSPWHCCSSPHSSEGRDHPSHSNPRKEKGLPACCCLNDKNNPFPPLPYPFWGPRSGRNLKVPFSPNLRGYLLPL